MFDADKPHETMENAMPAADAERWFGQSPPDLSLTARSRGTDWIFNFMRSFYVDPSRANGVNNLVLPNAAMPHVLWELQGFQEAVFVEHDDGAGGTRPEFERFELVTPGALAPQEYDQFVRDLANFLEYIGEPVQLERRALGIRVLFFLLVLFFFSLMLKKEYWKDVH